MPESIIRQAMTTWLKAECQDVGENMIYALLAIDYAQNIGYKLGDPMLRARAASDIQDFLLNAASHINTRTSNLLTDSERLKVDKKRKEIIDLLQELERPHIHETPGLLPAISDKLYEFNILTRQLLLEKVVECQCGKPGEEKYSPLIVHSTLFPETNEEWQSLVVAIKTARRKEAGEYTPAFDSLVDERFESIRFSLPEADDAKKWLMAKAGVLNIKEY